jgi:hypothetical protein
MVFSGAVEPDRNFLCFAKKMKRPVGRELNRRKARPPLDFYRLSYKMPPSVNVPVLFGGQSGN